MQFLALKQEINLFIRKLFPVGCGLRYMERYSRTQFLMNSSATVLVLPIAIMLCQAAGINPLAGAMSVSVCASGAFVTPFGTAPNLLVWEAGGYSVKDYLKCGFPMLIIFGVVTTALCAVFYL